MGRLGPLLLNGLQLTRINLAWCPKANRLNGSLVPRKIVPSDRVLVLGVVLGALLGPLIIGLLIAVPWSYEPLPPLRVEKLEIWDVKLNSTSRMIVCELQNTGTVNATLTEVRVNDSIVETGDPLPLTIEVGHWHKYAFRYDGPWEGAIEITFYTEGGRIYPELVYLRP